MFKRISTLLAVLGFIFAVWMVATAKQPIPSPPPAYPPSVNPFGKGIVALGIVEPGSRVVEVAPPEAGRVQRVHVNVGASVKAGDPLFTLDTSLLEAEMIRVKARRDLAGAELRRQESWPRKEDLPPLKAAVDEARSRYDDAADRLRSLEQAGEQDAANPDEVSRQRFLAAALRNSLAQAQANLDKYLAGAWEQDVAVARVNLAAAQAEVDSLAQRIERLTTRSPLDATILKRDIEPGEYASPGFAPSGAASQGVITLADLSSLNIRAQVDEEDSPLLKPGARAVARIRGAFDTQLPLTMLWIEPLARPKQQISNAAVELVDTRVIDVLFKVAPDPSLTLYPGQVVDVYIDAGETSK